MYKKPPCTSDASTSLLLQHCATLPGKLLWLADEHHHEAVFEALASYPSQVQVMTNRYDVYRTAEAIKLPVHFCDWVFDRNTFYDAIALRLCKEKAVNKHIFAQALPLLTPRGQLLLAGEKTEGIKSYCKGLQEAFDHGGQPQKHGNAYLACFESPLTAHQQTAAEEYHYFQEIGNLDKVTLHSKPGQYGWNKIDQGSQLLVEHFQRYCATLPAAKLTNLLDLGCGYGYLTLATANLPFHSRTATDNNAAAVLSCDHNAFTNGLNVTVVADNLGQSIQEKFDFILCNPPFHKGFDVKTDLIGQFLKAAQTMLSKKGQAFFVVNSFVGLENKASHFFRNVSLLENTGQFKVFRLANG